MSVIKSIGWATAPYYTLAPYESLPTKQVPSAAVQEQGIVPNVAPGAAELNYMLSNFDKLVGALERFEIRNFRSASSINWPANEVGPVAIRTPTGGVMLFRASTAYVFDQTLDVQNFETYDPTQGEGAGVLVPPNQSVVCEAVQTPNFLTNGNDVTVLAYDDFCELLGPNDTLWPRDSAAWAGGRTTLTLSQNTTPISVAWDPVRQILHMVTQLGYGNWNLNDTDANGNNVYDDADVVVPYSPFPTAFSTKPVVEVGNGVAMACDTSRCYVSLDGRTWIERNTLPVFSGQEHERVNHWWSDVRERWYLVTRRLNLDNTTADVLLHESTNDGASWSEVANFTSLTEGAVNTLKRQNLPTVRLRHMALFPFDRTPDLGVGNPLASAGVLVFDEFDETISIQQLSGVEVNWLLNDGDRLIWCTGDQGDFQLSTSLSLTSSATPTF